jgi:hypothetical protein
MSKQKTAARDERSLSLQESIKLKRGSRHRGSTITVISI